MAGQNPFSTVNLGTIGRGTWGAGTSWGLPTYTPVDFSQLRNIINGQSQTAGGIKVTTPQIQAGQTTLDKILSTTLSLFALHKQAPYVPTTTQPQNQYGGGYDAATLQYLAQQQAIGGGAGANLGASLESFVTNNTGILLVGVVALVLFKSGRK